MTSRSQTWTVRKPVVRGRQGMVAAQHVGAAEVGAEVLRAGGNAVDAALATALALTVVEPWMSGLGGGGFLIVAPGDGSRPQVVDFGMIAPLGLDPRAYPLVEGRDSDLFGWPAVEGDRNISGPLAIAVPREAPGLDLARERFGTMPFRDLVAPAIELARHGLPVSWLTTLRIAVAARDLLRFDSSRLTFMPEGLPPLPEAGALPLPHLTATLEHLAEAGLRDLVDGDLAHALVQDLREMGSPLTMADLVRTPATVGETLEIRHGDALIHAAGGLTAGPTLGQALVPIAGRIARGTPASEAYLAWAEGLSAAYEHRFLTMGDEADRLLPTSTTHLAVVDREGTMVSLTQTLLSVFGSRVVAPETGILMNNGIMWFDPRPGRPNSIRPGRRPLSNMCPIVVERGGRPWFALGASGGRRILPAVTQIASLLIDAGFDLETAFHTPRLDVSGDVHITADVRVPKAAIRALEAQFAVVQAEPAIHPNPFACPSAVAREGQDFVGMTDVGHPHAAAVAA